MVGGGPAPRPPVPPQQDGGRSTLKTRLRARRRVGPDETQHTLPGIRRLGLILLIGAVEEAVRRARVGDQLVLDARGGERLIELLDALSRDALVRAAEESQHRAFELRRLCGRRDAGKALRAGGIAVEADDARPTVVLHPPHEREETAQAETGR